MVKDMKRYFASLLIAASLLVGCGNAGDEAQRPAVEPITENPALQADPVPPLAEWSGKTVLLETFSGVDCPPCAAVNLAVEALTEAYGRDRFVTISYHIPIPGPDPMMTRASHFRAYDYDATRAPMTFFDGAEKFRGGGRAERARHYFDLYRGVVDSLLLEKPALTIEADASVTGDSVTVTGMLSALPENMEINVVLVQKSIGYLGRSRMPEHKMVVRHREILSPKGRNFTVVLDLSAIEEANLKWLENVERNYDPYRFREKKHRLDRSGLAAVVFTQDRETMKVHNARYAEIK